MYLPVMSLARSAFQSTHPVRGATLRFATAPPMSEISIHAPREGCDLGVTDNVTATTLFQSTHPVRGATTPRNRYP